MTMVTTSGRALAHAYYLWRRTFRLLPIVFFTTISLFPVLLRAEAPNPAFEGKHITGIVFDPPDQPYPISTLLDLLPLKTGAVFQQRNLPGAIQALFTTGRFSDIAVDGTETNGGALLKFITKRAYFVGRVTVTGVKEPPNSGQLASATKLQLGTPFSEGDKNGAVESLKNLLRRNGYYDATIDAQTHYKPETEQVDVTFDIDSGKRARYERPVITGHPERAVESIITSSKWQRLWGLLGWREVTDIRTQQGLDNIRRYYQKKELLLARVNLQQLDYHSDTNTVLPSVNIEAGRNVIIRTDGMRIRKGKLKQLIPVYQERTIDKDLLVEGQHNLEQYLETQGYFDADVSFDQESQKSDAEAITYNIDKGDRHKLVKLSITGNHYFDIATLRERMYVTPAQFPRFPHGRYSEALLNKDIQAIRDLYRTNGFRDATVTYKTVDDYQGKATQLAVFITINEQAQTFVSKVAIEGPSPADQNYIRSILLSSEGQPFSELSVAADRDNILNYFYNNGYLRASFDYSAEPANQPQRVNLKFVITPGPQRTVRRVIVDGLATTRSRLVTDRIELKSGDPLSLSKTTDSERRLYDLGIFARVNTALQNPDGLETSKYVLYELEEARRYSLNFGIGAQVGRIGGGTSLSAPAGATGFSPRVSFGVTRLNVMGLGHTVTLQTRLSNIQQQAAVSYLAPQFIGSQNLSLNFTTLYDSSHDIRTFSAIRREASVQLSQKLSRANSLQYRLVFRRVTQGQLLINPLLVPLLSQPVRVGLIGMSFIQDKRDDPADSHRGTYTTIDAGYASRYLGSQTTFSRIAARNSTYYRVGRDFVLARSTYFGWVQRISGVSFIPLSERFFSGGSASIRAFPENQAGPRDTVTGFPLGGNAMLINNVELRFPLLGDNLGGVLFHDAGNVYDDVRDISFRFRQHNLQDFNYMVQSVGVGIRYRTPIGPVRFDLSFSPNSPRFYGLKGSFDDFLNPNIHLPSVNQRINQFQFHFSLGQAF